MGRKECFFGHNIAWGSRGRRQKDEPKADQKIVIRSSYFGRAFSHSHKFFIVVSYTAVFVLSRKAPPHFVWAGALRDETQTAAWETGAEGDKRTY